jgi:putative aldouronate transport system permease protein
MQRREVADLLKYSLIVVASVPVLLIYPFVARYFTKGILIGAVKG